jgi:hypothetical protein
MPHAAAAVVVYNLHQCLRCCQDRMLEPLTTAACKASPQRAPTCLTSAVAITAGVMVLSLEQSASLPSKTCSHHNHVLGSAHITHEAMHRCNRLSFSSRICMICVLEAGIIPC